MEQRKKSKPSASKNPKDRHEIGVCGTGKHRVININPLLLTPSSASKLYHGNRVPVQNPNKKDIRNESNSTLLNVMDVENSQDGDNLANFATNSTETLRGGNLNEDLHQSNLGNSEPSLSSSLVTLDDINSFHESQISDISDFESVSELSYTSSMPKTILSNETPVLRTNLFDNRTPNPGAVSLSGTKSAGINLGGRYLQHRKGPAKHERVIEISPSLMLPVTSLPSTQVNHEFLKDFPSYGVEEKIQVGSMHTVSTNSSRTSLSDAYSLRHPNTDGVESVEAASSYSEQDFTTLTGGTAMQAECEHLKQALKLADADIAILVSSKQQLQLNLHVEEERVKSLTGDLSEANETNQNFDATIKELKASLHEKEENHKTEVENYQSQLQKLKSESDGLQNWLDVSRAERDSKKLEIEELTLNLETHMMKIGRLEKELKEVTSKNIKLDEMLQEASMKDEGAEYYIKHLKDEKNDLTRKLREKEQVDTLLQISNKTLEARLVDLQQVNHDLCEKAVKHEARFREIDAENVALRSRLQTAIMEKTDLNAAVLRLRSDLVKVETSFSRIKQQMIEKSRFAEQESSKRAELEEKTKVLTLEVAKLHNVNAETRIRDKNVQIEQLLTKSKMSTLEKSKLDRKLEKLQAHIESNEKSWVEAIEREKQYTRSLKEKDDTIALKSNEFNKLCRLFTEEKQIAEDLSSSLENSEKTNCEMKMKLDAAENSMNKLMQENNTISTMVEQLRSELQSEKERCDKSAGQQEEEITRLRNKIQRLNDEVEALQKGLVAKEEEVHSLKYAGETSTSCDQEDHDLHQLELLSELQAARRQLSHEKDTLVEENNSLKLSLYSLEQEIQGMVKRLRDEEIKHKKRLEEVNEKAEIEMEKVDENVKLLEKSLKENEKSKSLLKKEIEGVEDHNNILSQNLGTLQIHCEKLAEDLKKKIQENDEINSKHKIGKEEMELLKQELGHVTLQLTNALQDNTKRDDGRATDLENLVKERDILRNAVARQQQYAISLQKHYENWAKEATDKMRQEVMNVRAMAKEERMSIVNDMVKEQLKQDSLHAEMLLIDRSENIQKSTQTDCNIDPVGECKQEVKPNDENLDETASLMEEKLQLLEENTQQAEMIAVLEERIQNWSTMDSCVLIDSGTQTSHDEEALPALNNSTSEIIRLLEDSLTQTDHDNEPVGHGSFSQFQEEIVHLKRLSELKIRDLIKENDELKAVISNLDSSLAAQRSQEIFESSSTQTEHDFDPVASRNIAFLTHESASTQTEHAEEMFEKNGPESDWEKLLEENRKLKTELTLAMSLLQNLKASHSHMLEDSGTQTDHNDQPMVPMSQIPHVVNATLLEDSWTQTEHDDETISSSVHVSNTVVQLREELDISRQEVERVTEKFADITEENRRLNTSIHEHENLVEKSKRDFGIQTDHDNDPVYQTPTVQNALLRSVSTVESSCQSERDLQLVCSRSTETNDVNLESTQNATSNGTDNVLGSMESHGQDAQLPSPMTILKTMESKKLRAYKKTVHLMKKKLLAAEVNISNLQAELKMVTSSTPSTPTEFLKNGAGDNVEGLSAGDGQDFIALGEVKRAKSELYKVKKTAALQAEEAKRKALAERKILESKIASMSERISGLTSANAQLRNSVETLQVKVTEKSRQGDIALREKNRFQMRARRLQASLTSLAWIAENQGQSTLLTEDFTMEDSFGDSLVSETSTENLCYNSQQDSVKSKKSRGRKSLSNLPASVVEIEESLKDLQIEIVALEKQMQEHNTAVRKSKSQWSRLKEESNGVCVPRTQTRTPILSNNDHVAQISKVV